MAAPEKNGRIPRHQKPSRTKSFIRIYGVRFPLLGTWVKARVAKNRCVLEEQLGTSGRNLGPLGYARLAK